MSYLSSSASSKMTLWSPLPLGYGYEERRDRDCGRDRGRDERYEDWEEVDLERDRR